MKSVDRFLQTHQRLLLWIAIILMFIAAVYRLHNEFIRLLFDQGSSGAIDLKFRYADVHRWFHGQPVYQNKDAIYPPASYVLLWPLLGWLPVQSARWLWAITSVMVLGWLMYLLVRESKAAITEQRLFIALLLPSMYATSATIGNGQLILHLLPFLLLSILFLQRPSALSRDIVSGLFFVIAFVKPAIALPFFWILIFSRRSYRPALMFVAIYLLITAFAVSLQPGGWTTLFSDWLSRGSAAASRGGYANLHSWLVALGLKNMILPASLVVLLLFGFWIYKQRSADLWILLGVGALVARFWMYHRLYDDVLVVLPMLSLFRIAKSGNTLAALLLSLLWMAALAPARLLSYPPPWSILFELLQTSVWIACLVYLIRNRTISKEKRVSFAHD